MSQWCPRSTHDPHWVLSVENWVVDEKTKAYSTIFEHKELELVIGRQFFSYLNKNSEIYRRFRSKRPIDTKDRNRAETL